MQFKLDANPDSLLGSPIHIYCELQKFLQQPDGHFNDLEKLIRLDPLLTARLIRAANDPQYGNKSEVATITQAMTLVNSSELLDLVGATKIVGKFQGIPNQLFNMHLYWLHSVIVGFTAQAIAKIKNEDNPERYYVAGLLHDLGRLEICLSEPEKIMKIFNALSSGDHSVTFYEEQYLEINHSAVGSALFRHWQFPEFLQAVVANHHDPLNNHEWKSQSSILHLADHLAYEMGIGCGKIPSSGFNPEVTNLLELDKGSLDLLWKEMNIQLEKISDEYL